MVFTSRKPNLKIYPFYVITHQENAKQRDKE
jgi:hypothetical protein